MHTGKQILRFCRLELTSIFPLFKKLKSKYVNIAVNDSPAVVERKIRMRMGVPHSKVGVNMSEHIPMVPELFLNNYEKDWSLVDKNYIRKYLLFCLKKIFQ